MWYCPVWKELGLFFFLRENVLQGYNDSCFLDFHLDAYLYMFAAYFLYYGVGKSRKVKDTTCNTVQYCL